VDLRAENERIPFEFVKLIRAVSRGEARLRFPIPEMPKKLSESWSYLQFGDRFFNGFVEYQIAGGGAKAM